MDNHELQTAPHSVDGVISLFSTASSGSIQPATLLESLTSSLEAEELQRLRNWAISKGCAAKEFDNAVRRWRLKLELGRIPSHERDFIEAFAASRGITPTFDGSLSRPQDEQNFSLDYTRVHFERDALLTNARLHAGFDKSLVRPAIDQWLSDAKRDHLARVWARIDAPNADRREQEWIDLAAALADTDRVSTGYASALFKKFIWQVKRKMKGLPVTDHLMMVLTGPQGNGKSTLVEKLLEPLQGCERKVNFGEITDARNIEMWSSYVLFADEMEKAAKADIEAIKNAITTDTLSRRILGSGSMTTVSQCATLIGATNGSLGSNIRDTTGMRRFGPLPTLRKPGKSGRTVDREVINRTDFAALWRSVQVDDPDPMLGFHDELDALQEEEREKSSAELWLDDLRVEDIGEWHFEKDGSITAKKLYAHFREYEAENCPGPHKLSIQQWGREVARLTDADPERAKFTKKRTREGMRYVPAHELRRSNQTIVNLRDACRKAG